jgi:hypothetical protein
MSNTILVLIAALAGVIAGAAITWVLYQTVMKSKREGILAEAEKEGETIKEKDAPGKGEIS